MKPLIHNPYYREIKRYPSPTNQYKPNLFSAPAIFYLVATILISLAILLELLCFPVHASPTQNLPHLPTSTNFWKGIVGEAIGESHSSITAIIWVYRTRLEKGMPLGMCALNRPDLNRFVLRQPSLKVKWVREEINRVFSLPSSSNPTSQATHYENVQRFGVPSWARNMTITCKIGNHTFFKEKN